MNVSGGNGRRIPALARTFCLGFSPLPTLGFFSIFVRYLASIAIEDIGILAVELVFLKMAILFNTEEKVCMLIGES